MSLPAASPLLLKAARGTPAPRSTPPSFRISFDEEERESEERWWETTQPHGSSWIDGRVGEKEHGDDDLWIPLLDNQLTIVSNSVTLLPLTRRTFLAFFLQPSFQSFQNFLQRAHTYSF
jgi:hypothetical protein